MAGRVNPNAVEKRWRESVRGIGSIIIGSCPIVEIHHVIGRTAIHKKVQIGHLFILPLAPYEHALLTGTDMDREFIKTEIRAHSIWIKPLSSMGSAILHAEEYRIADLDDWDQGQLKKFLFRSVEGCLSDELPYPDHVSDLIQDWHR